MMMANWSEKLYKGKARDFALSALPFALPDEDDAIPMQRSIWLPSDKAECIKLALKKGLLKRTSKIIAVERDASIFAAMSAELTKLGMTNATRRATNLHEVKLTGTLDFANIDLCGSMTHREFKWIADELLPHMTDGGNLVLTTTFGWRNNPLMRYCEEFFEDKYSMVAHDVAANTHCNDIREIVPLLVLMSAMRHKIMHVEAVRYRDVNHNNAGTTMIVYRLLGITDRPNHISSGMPSYAEIFTGFMEWHAKMNIEVPLAEIISPPADLHEFLVTVAKEPEAPPSKQVSSIGRTVAILATLGEATLSRLYAAYAAQYPEGLSSNYQSMIRKNLQVFSQSDHPLNKGGRVLFVSPRRGVWKLLPPDAPYKGELGKVVRIMTAIGRPAGFAELAAKATEMQITILTPSMQRAIYTYSSDAKFWHTQAANGGKEMPDLFLKEGKGRKALWGLRNKEV